MEEQEQEWVQVATAPAADVAEEWCEILQQEQIPTQLALGDVNTIFGTTGMPVHVLVPAEFFERADTLLTATLSLDEDALAGDEDVPSTEDLSIPEGPGESSSAASHAEPEDAGGGNTAG